MEHQFTLEFSIFMGMSLKRIVLAFSFVFVWVLTKILAINPEWTEQVYSNSLYTLISKLCRYAFGWVPFSVGDVFYTLVVLLLLRWLIKNWRRSYKDFKNWILELLTGVSFIYLAFHCFWAFNYYRQPLHVNLEMGKDYSTEQLVSVTELLIESSNNAHEALQNMDSLKVEVPYSKKDILDMTQKGYKALSKSIPLFTYKPSSIKASLYSLPLTYMGFSGYLNPFTNEAQVDILIPKYQLPSTASHEVAHQLGYAAENEANFIGMLACIHHPDPYFNYSGQVFGLRYCLNELYLRDQEAYQQLRTKIRPGIFKNFKESRDFWNSYENPLEPLFKTTYDSYLKVNNQNKGIESYSYVVALIVNYYDETPTKR
ncbi:DUF3810 domain-containing protein [Winogradskyella aurantiaca]|uniref:DUF3810 domain-containing protein n=1 Tax=Winogradskyella aurantiaca TaxID=2219558 RepID=UPI001E5FD33B|nr:DUF3810 domain-containing protein [Winogradskyella aurantiaca]